jgi:alpha-amylase
MRKILFGITLALILAAPVSAAPNGQEVRAIPWWNDRVFYEVFVRAFQDSDGDGNGDLQGLIDKLDYLNDGDPTTTTDLGITGLWLMPIMEGDTYHGYHITDFEQVEADYGTNDDFKMLIDEAHERGIAVIVDLIINHTSNQHPWFIDAQRPGSEHDPWYIWSLTNPRYPGPWGQRVWHEAAGRYYYGVFNGLIPDLNLSNPDVTQVVYDFADFWLNEMDVDGFRLDAVKHLVEMGRTQENTEGTLNWLTSWNEYIKSVKPDVFTVGEVQSSSFITALYVPERLDTTFEFELAGAIADAVNRGNGSNLENVQAQLLERFAPGQYAAFLSNHDFNRILNVFSDNMDKVKVAASILLTQPGVPFIYYGEEIGMTGVKPDECIRVPFQWDATVRVAPFMEGKGCESNEGSANVAAETDDPDSLLSHYRDLIHLRNDHSALRAGTFTTVESTSDAVYSFIRQDADERLLVVINLSDEAVSDYGLTLASGLSEVEEVSLLYGEGEVTSPTIGAEGGFADYMPLPEFPAYSTLIIQFGD